MSKSLSVVSLALSAVAVTIALLVYFRADMIADEALQRREQQIVDRLKPEVHNMYREFDLELAPSAEQPKSLDDLFAPMIRLVSGVPADEG